MIAQQFEYSAPKTLDEALGLLAEGAKPLAGGMSLIPMMKLRLAAPEHLVDLGRIKDLSYIREQGTVIHIGATTCFGISMIFAPTSVTARCSPIHELPCLRKAGRFAARAQTGTNLSLRLKPPNS